LIVDPVAPRVRVHHRRSELRGGVTRIYIIVCRHELTSCDYWYRYDR
jgi:hypothetical protein